MMLPHPLPFFPTRRARPDGGRTCVEAESIRTTVAPTGLPAEGFRITASSAGVSIEGDTAASVAYARATVGEVAAASPDGTFPSGVFEDYPDFPTRGYMLDISRCKVPTMDHLRRLVDTLAKLRYNQLQLYMEHTFAYSGHGEIWAEASPMTAAEVRALDAYCKERHIELVPNQNSFGHMERWLRHPRYRALAECPDGFIHPISGPRTVGSVLYPGEESLALLDELYGELLPNFTSTRFNVGCDEPWELGQGRSRAAVEQRGKQHVYLDFLRKIEHLVARHGRVMHYWADILLEQPELIPEAPSGAVPILWGYDVDHPFAEQCAVLAENGLEFHIAPGDATWRCFSGRLETTLRNQRAAAREGLRHGASGYVLTHWGDLGHHQTWPTALAGLVIGGELAWNAAADVEASLPETLNRLFFGEDSPTLANALLALGRLDAQVPPIRVGSWFFESLMRTDEVPLPPATAASLLDQLDAVEACIRGARPSADDSAWLRDEIHLGIGMTRWAVRRNGGTGEQAAWERERAEWIERFREVWLRRNRPGGLKESVAYFG